METVHAKLVQGIEENAELVVFVRVRAHQLPSRNDQAKVASTLYLTPHRQEQVRNLPLRNPSETLPGLVLKVSCHVAFADAVQRDDTHLGAGFGTDDGASLLVAFRGLQAESVKQGEAHRGVARDLENLVADPFEAWAAHHEQRVMDSKRTLVDGWLRSYEEAAAEVCLFAINSIRRKQS